MGCLPPAPDREALPLPFAAALLIDGEDVEFEHDGSELMQFAFRFIVIEALNIIYATIFYFRTETASSLSAKYAYLIVSVKEET